MARRVVTTRVSTCVLYGLHSSLALRDIQPTIHTVLTTTFALRPLKR
jgi:hypothetical protein